MSDWAERFNALVLEWLQQWKPDAVEVVKVGGSGTDSYVGTFAGFDANFSAWITYRETTGATHTFDVAGEDMASLWSAVVSGTS